VSKLDELNWLMQEAGIQEDQVEKTYLLQVLNMILKKILPYPLEKSQDECPICKRKKEDHSPLDYFVNDKHRFLIQQYFSYLTTLEGKTEALETKIELESPEVLMSPKEIMLQFGDLLNQGKIQVINVLAQLHTHYTTYERLKEETLNLKETLDSLEIRYQADCSKYLNEYWWYLERTQKLKDQLKHATKKEIELAKKALGKNLNLSAEEQAYQKLREGYEEQARRDYYHLCQDLQHITREIVRNHQAVEKFEERKPYEEYLMMLQREKQKPTIIQTRTPTVRVRRE